MKISSILVFSPLLALAAAPMPAQAQPASVINGSAEQVDLIEVTEVKFLGAKILSGDTWLEMSVEVAAKPGGRSISGEFVDKVRVTLNLGLESGEGAAKKWAFYRSSAEAVSLEGGAKAIFRFYLPPEVLKRDRVSLGEANKLYVVELEAAGKPVQTSRAGVSAKITSEDARRVFLSRVVAEGSRNEGVLVPQYLSPFAHDAQRRAPSVVRRDGQR